MQNLANPRLPGMMRIAFFLLTNLAVILVISVIFTSFKIGNVLDEQGVDVRITALREARH